MTSIGFVGLGNMGGHMARNLVAAGHSLKVYDLVDELNQSIDGASPQSSGADAAKDVDVFISMLPAGTHVADLYLTVGGVVDACRADTLLIDCSTIDPPTARRVNEAAAGKGLPMLDAPVSGGTAGAQAGTLTFIVGGTKIALERARSVLGSMGSNIFHAGDNGAGQVAKICNNMLLAVQMTGTAEALALGVKNGLDPEVLSDIMRQSSGSNWPLHAYNPYPGVMEGVPAARNYGGGFFVDLMTKDLGLAMATAEDSHSSVPMGALAKNLYCVHQQLHHAGQLDFSSIQWLFAPELRPESSQ